MDTQTHILEARGIDPKIPVSKNAFSAAANDNNKVDNQAPNLQTLHETEARVAQAIAKSTSPILFITDDYSNSGALAGYMANTLPFVPIVFETQNAQKTFLKQAGVDYRRIEAMTIGIVSKTSERQSKSPVFDRTDCIITMGLPKPAIKDELDAMKSDRCSVFYHNSRGINPRVNFALIAKEGIDRKPDWLKQARKLVLGKNLL